MLGDKDRAALLIAAGRAAEALEDRASEAGVTMTFSTDEVKEIAEQFARVVAMLTAWHLASSDAVKEQLARRPEVA